MTKLMISLAAGAIAAAGFAVLPAPAAAQAGGNQSEVIVYGTDPCPRSTDDQIVVCRRLPETQRYRLSKEQQLQGTRQQRESWAQKSRPLTTLGNTGTNSCSPVGPGGFTGCLTQQIQQARQESQEQSQQSTAPQQ
jgi:hypothetical protein